MAAACSIRDFQNSVIPYMQYRNSAETLLKNSGEGGVAFHSLMLNRVAEVAEDSMFYVPKGSLLEWIDAWYSHPNDFLDKTLGKEVNVYRAMHAFYDDKNIDSPLNKSIAPWIHFKSFSRKGDSMPQNHGEFSVLPFWRAEFRNTGNIPGIKPVEYYTQELKTNGDILYIPHYQEE